jgi:hypothetical protein
MRLRPDTESEPLGRLSNGDQVEVLRDDTEQWYEVRIRNSVHPDVEGQIGWIERWLVDDDQNLLPPTPTITPTASPVVEEPTVALPPTPFPPPAARVFAASVADASAGQGNSDQYGSCVQGQVIVKSGSPHGAIISINNGDVTYERTSGGGGYYQFCGLGASNWTVVLYWVPGDAELASQPYATVYVNGAPGETAVINFVEQ